MNRVVLAVHRQHGDARRARRRHHERPRPSRGFPCSRARSSCRRRWRRARRRAPPCRTRRTARRRRRDGSRPRSGRRRRCAAVGATGRPDAPARRAHRRAPRRRHRDRVGRKRATCSANRAMFSPAASATTRSRSGCASTTASALWPIDPVDPRIAIRFMWSRELRGTGRTRSRPAPRTASCRSDRARRRGRE